MNSDSKAWARKLVAEYEAGKPMKPMNVYRIAYQALRLEFPEGRPGKPAAQVPLPKRAPLDDPWWDNEPTTAAPDSN